MPNIKKNIFNRKKLNYLLSRLTETSIPDLNAKLEINGNWKNFIRSGNIYDTKETALQGNFLTDIFSGVLGYKSRIKNYDEWNLNQEQTTAIDGKSADGSLGFFSKDKEDVRAVIELKDANTNLDERQHRHNDTRTPVEQAFSYQHKTGKSCKWVIVSNFREIRLYHSSSSTEYEVFFIEELDNFDTFKRFYFLLNCSNLISKSGASEIDSLYVTNEAEEQNISKEFYSAFKQARLKLFDHIKANNPDKPEMIVLEKTQKLLDRFIFICFCEDNRLLPDKTYRRIVETANKSFSFNDTKIWNELKGLFHAINIGSPQHGINKFNGGLFAADMELDSLIIKDGALAELQPITDYDFESDVDVNILGHIFEQSISDIEEIKSGIEGKDYDKKTSKRKKDGIYYTPEYITKYIVENAVGGWLEDRKKELGFYELPELSESDLQSVKIVKGKTTFNEIVRKHFDFWTAYKEKLMNIKVIDPACGSGAFLNQAFNFLFAEGQKVNDTLARLTLGQGVLFELDKHILSNNIYGVDLNNESVEITRLSLWLKTANKHSELTALDKNIKCGNSLIDDPAVAGDKAFDWNKEFSEIIQSGGFDVVIGNPPYVHLEKIKDVSSALKNSGYETYHSQGDLYVSFVEKGIKLLNHSGMISYIMPNKWLQAGYGKPLREFFLKYELKELIDFGDIQIFDGATTYPCIFIVRKAEPQKQFSVSILKDSVTSDFYSQVRNDAEIFDAKSFNGDTWVISSNNEKKLLERVNNNCKKLSDWVGGQAFRGVLTGLTEAFLIDEKMMLKIIEQNNNDTELLKPVIRGRDIKPWYGVQDSYYLIGTFPALNIDIDNYPAIKEYLISFGRNRLEQSGENGSRKKTNNKWFETQDTIGYYKEFSKPKIMYQKFQVKPCFIYDDNGLFCNDSMWIIPTENKALLGVLNSKMGWWLITKYCTQIQNGYQLIWKYFGQIPIPELDSAELEQLVNIMLNLNKEFQQYKNAFMEFISGQFGIANPSNRILSWHDLKYEELIKEIEKTKIKLSAIQKFDLKPLFDREKAKVMELKSKIAETDRKIDSLVYELYGLTEEEIKVVERV